MLEKVIIEREILFKEEEGGGDEYGYEWVLRAADGLDVMKGGGKKSR